MNETRDELRLAPSRAAASPKAPEHDLWAGRTHWLHHAGGIGLWLAAAILYALLITRIDALSGAAAWYVAGIPILLSALFLGGWLLLRIYGSRYRVTDERLFLDRGILRLTIDQTELIRVDDVRVHKTVVDRLFGLGSVEVLSTDASHHSVTLCGIRGADHVAEIIRTRMRTLRGKSLFIENL
ncbi:MAG: PH domain-containing protein [Phycisphaerae bacterium]|nr:PH domain-containing protein [Phycisphaerae bacterium]